VSVSGAALSAGPGLLHGEVGSWDELAVVVVGFVVIWAAVKLAGRKPPGNVEVGSDEPIVEESEGAPPVTPRH